MCASPKTYMDELRQPGLLHHAMSHGFVTCDMGKLATPRMQDE